MSTTRDGPAVIDVKPNTGKKKSRSLPQLWRSQSEYCYNVWYEKTRMLWLHDGEKFCRYIYLFRSNTRTWQTDGRTDTARRHRPHLYTTLFHHKYGTVVEKQAINKTKNALNLCIASRGNHRNHPVRFKDISNQAIWALFLWPIRYIHHKFYTLKASPHQPAHKIVSFSDVQTIPNCIHSS